MIVVDGLFGNVSRGVFMGIGFRGSESRIIPWSFIAIIVVVVLETA